MKAMAMVFLQSRTWGQWLALGAFAFIWGAGVTWEFIFTGFKVAVIWGAIWLCCFLVGGLLRLLTQR
jgi:hypothetical protein